MIKIINVYKDSRVMEMTSSSNIGLGVKTDNDVDLLRFTFDEMIVGTATLLTTLTDDNGDLVAFPLTLNQENNSYDLEVTNYVASQTNYTIQVEIVNDEMIWHSKQADIILDECLEIGEGEMPTTIENWLQNANIVLSEMEQATRETENLNIEVGTETSTTIPVTFTDKEGNQTTVNIKGARGEKGEQGIPGSPGTPGQDATINGVNTLTIEEGQNITIEQVGNVMTISSTGGGGGSTNYNDLSNKPSINNVTLQGNKSLTDLGIQPSGDYVTPSDLSSVATSGSYNDLTNKPTIPSKTSDLTNDSGFITNSVDNLTNYYTKSSTDTLLGNKEDKSNKVTSLSSSSTDTQYPSAKCVYDLVGDINTALDTINGEVV